MAVTKFLCSTKLYTWKRYFYFLCHILIFLLIFCELGYQVFLHNFRVVILVLNQVELTRALLSKLVENIDLSREGDHRDYNATTFDRSYRVLDVIWVTVCDARVYDKHLLSGILRNHYFYLRLGNLESILVTWSALKIIDHF